jgi:hypothetical protein
MSTVGEKKLAEFVLVFKFLDSTGSIDDLLRTCEERVTLIADIDRHFRLVRSYFKLVSTSTFNFTFHIFWVNTFSHLETFQSLIYKSSKLREPSAEDDHNKKQQAA